MKNSIYILGMKALCLLFLLAPLFAQEKAPVELQLIPGGTKDGKVLVGLSLDIPKSWHVYAPSPQKEEVAGFEPTITWDKSSNLKDAKIMWPVPHQTEIQDQKAYVYEGKTMIPLELTPNKRESPISLTLQVSFLACSSLCVPVEETLTLNIKPGEQGQQVMEALQKREDAYEGLSLISLLLIALLGGLVLNVMPCVLPVLSLKIMSLVKQSKKNHMNHAKQGFLLTGLGILTSFLLLAILTIILKESGEAFGWGIHFQNPGFLLFVFLVLIAFSASLWGVFEIDLPSGIGNWLISHEGKGRIKDFLSGIFATLLATPCSAPFVGTALSFALARNTSDIILVFFCLGLGFASPYFLVSAIPTRFIRLPKPGMWMIRVQHILGVLLGVTALWIGWVLSFHLPLWVLGTSVSLTFIALSLFWIKYHKKPELRAWTFATPLFLLAWSMAWIFPLEKHNPSEKLATSSSTLDLWQPFEPDAISAFVKQGKVVFVDVTAEWCVTCAANKALVLNDPHITKLLARSDVIAMKADWTMQDSRITHFLQDHGRYGIPFNIVFGPKNPQGVALPEIFTIHAVEEAFEKAGLPLH